MYLSVLFAVLVNLKRGQAFEDVRVMLGQHNHQAQRAS